jgi:carboxypeptidase C (cathepsin A)
MTLSRIALPATAAFALLLAPGLHAQGGGGSRRGGGGGAGAATTPAPGATPAPAGTPKESAKSDTLPNNLPADKSVLQTATINGKTLHYTATVGTIALKAKDGKTTGEVMYTAYTMEGAEGHHRPITFAFNGGPGASSVYLNLGAIGPKRVGFGNAGESQSDPANLTDNPGTWLDFTDLVFIDPIGTGFSKSLVDDNESKKLFYAPTPDIEYLSMVIYKYLIQHGRLLDKKYLIGESYGGYRGPRIAHYLQTELGVAVNGVTLVSPYLNPSFGDPSLSPVEYMTTLPSITAANLERQGKLTDAAMRDVIAYTEGDYALALIHGPEDKAATDAMIAKVTQMTGLDPQFVRYSGGRLETSAYLREVHREQGAIGSVYDSNVTLPDPFPFSPYPASNDPLLESIIAPTTSAMADFITRIVGWKTDDRYNALSGEVNRLWDRSGRDLQRGAVPDLREAVAADPKIKFLIVHGWNDLSCPFMGSVLTKNQLPANLQGQVEIHEFPGGHMFYTRDANGAGLHQMAERMVESH